MAVSRQIRKSAFGWRRVRIPIFLVGRASAQCHIVFYIQNISSSLCLKVNTCDVRPVFDLYGRWVVSSGVLDWIQAETGMRSRRGIYSLAVVLWLMIWQRLQPRSTMSLA